ncbi:hypothetical protein DX877_11150 [Xylella fastidiosa subsp. fastidiosa]|nr:hypothetical protein DX878_11115 [Xylella fastidiosa subsp. fastidiosa]TNV90293.1 hypothetical protein C5H25_11370 [Xylella fastidiosa]RUA35028.1 hypothetical protein DX877_11150 [Xylella fastidiosa subsp. fastidiosa]RWA30461.1 hypothetical protein XfCFBP8071_09055 [Xylella fastidiosa subsp. fastidiosa]RWA39113.1 hypothetical protein XfCFBP8351_11420 [Xylella fastidiosa subsp. fastidiosa]
MGWSKIFFAYMKAIIFISISFLFETVIILLLKDNYFTAGIFYILSLVPLAVFLYGVFLFLYVSYRLWETEQGKGPICQRCCGPLGLEKTGRCGLYRTCLLCGKHAD